MTSSHQWTLGRMEDVGCGLLVSYDLGFIRISAAGPSSTIQSTGKMQPTIGSSIFSVAWAAEFTSAATLRCA